MKRLISLALISIIFLPVIATSNILPLQQSRSKSPQASLAALLEKTGYAFKKVSDGVYEVPVTGTNLKDFPIRLVQAGDILVIICKIADRKDVNLKEALAIKLLELNDNADVVKFAISEEMLYTRVDIHVRLVDVEELKYLIEISAQTIDEAYPHVKPFIAGMK